MDGLTVDGAVAINSNNFVQTAPTPNYVLSESDVTDENTQFLQASGTLRIRTVDDSGSNVAERMRIDHGTGDISFYEDTGTTAKLFWDASAESLGIGTSAPAQALHVESSASGASKIVSALVNPNSGVVGTGAQLWLSGSNATTRGTYIEGQVRGTGNKHDLIFATSADASSPSERMRIDSAGFVGIGTSSPTQKLHVDSGEVLVKSAYDATGTTNSKIYFATRQGGNWRNSYIGNTGDNLTFATGGTGTTHTNATERMRISSAGVVEFKGGITEDAETLTGTSTAIDISAATNFVHALTGTTVYTFSNPAATGNASSFTLKIIQDSTARAITWPSSVDWAGGTAPTLTAAANGVDVFVFYTIDGGTTYYGFTAGQAMA
jgi:hypothetical protein